MNLYEIDSSITALCDQETGEITDLSALDSLIMERNAKIENLACWIKNMDSDAKQLREEERVLAERRQRIENKKERIKAYLSERLAGEKFSSPRCEVTFRKTSHVELSDGCLEWMSSNRPDCISVKVEPKKAEISRAIKGGTAVPGAAIVDGLSMGVK